MPVLAFQLPVGRTGLRRPRMASFRSRNPIPVGAAFLAGLLVLFFLAFNFQNLPFTGARHYSAAFSEAAGLRPTDKVRVGGVAVGDVKGVKLEGNHVRVSFTITDHSVHLGRATSASIEIFTLLGNKYLALEPKGDGEWPSKQELPLTQTTSPYDVVPAFQDLSRNLGQIDTKQLAQAFDTMSETFKNSPEALKSTLNGLSRLSQTIASRDNQIGELLGHAKSLTTVFAPRRGQLSAIFSDGSKLLQELNARRQVIGQLLENTVSLSQQLQGLVKDNQAQIQPALDHLKNVTTILDHTREQLDESVTLLVPWARTLIDVTSAGPFFVGSLINMVNPFTVNNPLTSPPKTLGDLLGLTGLAVKK
jgi:phospholipid/cholesterol/gamma-HCH transport system substrate-binding protein